MSIYISSMFLVNMNSVPCISIGFSNKTDIAQVNIHAKRKLKGANPNHLHAISIDTVTHT